MLENAARPSVVLGAMLLAAFGAAAYPIGLSNWLVPDLAESSGGAPPARAAGASSEGRSEGAAPSLLTRGAARTVGETEDRLGRFEQSGRIRSVDSSSPPGLAPETPTAEFYRVRHAETIRRHRAEPIDREWGPRTDALINADLAKLEDLAKFHLLEVECRAHSCRAVVRWDRFDLARNNHQQLLTAPIRANCGRTILVPDAEDDAPVEATLILDCTDWKAQGSNPLPFELMPP